MAVFTDVRGLYVQRILPDGFSTVVAAEAVVGDVGMIKEDREPANGAVAVIAVVTTGDVGRVLAGRRRTVMAGTAAADNLRVIDHCWWDPYRRAMAIFADIG